MFCPKCKYEFKQGVTFCTNCESELVENLPEPIEENHELEYDFIEIVSTLNQGDIALIKSVLDGEDIEYQILDENFINVRPLVEAVRIIVREDQADVARELIKDFDIHSFALSKRTN